MTVSADWHDFATMIGERWVTEDAADGFTLQPATLPGSLRGHLFASGSL